MYRWSRCVLAANAKRERSPSRSPVSKGGGGVVDGIHREAKYLMNASSAGHGTFCVSAMPRTVPPSSWVRTNFVQSRPVCAHSSA
jgi:hypothetical protein